MSPASAPTKTCGACTFCCKVLGIEELAKPPGAWCPHCKPGAGCAAYQARPASCRGFSCQWLLEPAMPDAFRPDRCKVVFSSDAVGSRLVANCDPAMPAAWRSEPVYSFMKRMAGATWTTGFNVVAKAGLRLWVITPSEDIDLGEVDERSPLQVDQLAGGKARVRVLAPVPERADQGGARPEHWE